VREHNVRPWGRRVNQRKDQRANQGEDPNVDGGSLWGRWGRRRRKWVVRESPTKIQRAGDEGKARGRPGHAKSEDNSTHEALRHGGKINVNRDRASFPRVSGDHLEKRAESTIQGRTR